MKSNQPSLGRQITVKGMAYAPTTESAVVFLFGRLAPRLGFCVEFVRPQFPDCLATRRGKRYQIEFEFVASNYQRDSHRPSGADIVICWENDWEARPKKYRHLEIISLKDHVGAQPRVFVVGCQDYNFGELDYARLEWNVPTAAQIGDLVLLYRARPASMFCDLWKVVGPFNVYKKRNKEGRRPGRQAGLRRLVVLKHPITYSALARDPQTRELSVVKKRFMGKTDITEDWPMLYNRIVALNPKAKSALRPYQPD